MLRFEKVASDLGQLQEVRNINGETKRDLSDVETNLVLGGGSRHRGDLVFLFSSFALYVFFFREGS